MLIKLKKIIGQVVYKRHTTPERSNITCIVYGCNNGSRYKEDDKICEDCSSKINEPIENLYKESWDSKFCYTYVNEESSNNKG